MGLNDGGRLFHATGATGAADCGNEKEHDLRIYCSHSGGT